MLCGTKAPACCVTVPYVLINDTEYHGRLQSAVRAFSPVLLSLRKTAVLSHLAWLQGPLPAADTVAAQC